MQVSETDLDMTPTKFKVGDVVRITKPTRDPLPLEVGDMGPITSVSKYQLGVAWASGRKLLLLIQEDFDCFELVSS